MALSPVKKVYFFTGRHDHDALLTLLQKSGLVQLVPSETVLSQDDLEKMLPKNDCNYDGRIKKMEKKLSTVTQLITVLQKREAAPNLLAHFVHPKEVLSSDAFDRLAEFDETPIADGIKALMKEEEAVHIRQRQRQFQLRQLQLIADWPVDLAQLRDTQKTFVRLLAVPELQATQYISDMTAFLGEESSIEVVYRKLHQHVLLVIGRKDKAGQFLKWVEEYSLQLLEINEFSGSAIENIQYLRLENASDDEVLVNLDQQYRTYQPQLPILRQFHDYLTSELQRLEKQNIMRGSRYTTMLSGWVPALNIPDLQQRLQAAPTDATMVTVDADHDDSPPVSYQNPQLVKPFEFVTDLYSRPRYWEIDPSPFVGVFFALFFGICLTDAGYGILITLAALWAMKKLELPESSFKLVKILFFGGIATTIVGLLTGGIFGMGFQELPGPLHYLKNLTLLNPMQEQMNFLIFTLALGILHVTVGIILKFRWQLQHQQVRDAWLDQAPWLAIIAGVLMLIAASYTANQLLNLSGYLFLAGAAVVILLFGGRSHENPFARLAMGAFSLYQVTGLFGDVLSYARLFALGIATGVIAGVVNFLAGMAFDIPYLGYALMPVILIAGHSLNLAINALGGFIHTTRLQFVEFFGKFYEGGGESFEPFALTLKYTQIREQE